MHDLLPSCCQAPEEDLRRAPNRVQLREGPGALREVLDLRLLACYTGYEVPNAYTASDDFGPHPSPLVSTRFLMFTTFFMVF